MGFVMFHFIHVDTPETYDDVIIHGQNSQFVIGELVKFFRKLVKYDYYIYFSDAVTVTLSGVICLSQKVIKYGCDFRSSGRV